MLPTYNSVIHFDGAVAANFSVHVVAYGEIVFVGNVRGENHWGHYANKALVIKTVVDFMLLERLSRKLVFVFFKRWNGGESCCYHLIETDVVEGLGLVVGSRQQCLNREAIDGLIEALNNESRHLRI